MTGQIDGSAAGSYRNALERAASRFCVKYSEEAWHIAGVLIQTGLSLPLKHRLLMPRANPLHCKAKDVSISPRKPSFAYI